MDELDLFALAKIFFSVVLTDPTVRDELRGEQLPTGSRYADATEAADERPDVDSERFLTIVNRVLGKAGHVKKHELDRFVKALVDLASKAKTIDDKPLAAENVEEYFGITITALIDIGHGGGHR